MSYWKEKRLSSWRWTVEARFNTAFVLIDGTKIRGQVRNASARGPHI